MSSDGFDFRRDRQVEPKHMSDDILDKALFERLKDPNYGTGKTSYEIAPDLIKFYIYYNKSALGFYDSDRMEEIVKVKRKINDIKDDTPKEISQIVGEFMTQRGHKNIDPNDPLTVSDIYKIYVFKKRDDMLKFMKEQGQGRGGGHKSARRGKSKSRSRSKSKSRSKSRSRSRSMSRG